MTSDPDLEAETRFSPRSILDGSFPGEGVCSVEGGDRFLAQAALKGGERGKGVTPCSLSPALPGKGLRTFAFTEQVPGPGSSSLMMMMMVPGPPCPISSPVVVMGRCDRQGPITNSPSEGETGSHIILYLCNVYTLLP